MINRSVIVACLVFSVLSVAYETALAENWPMDRGDAERSGYTPEKLPATMGKRWVYQSARPPQPAWPRLERMPFDRAFHAVAANGLVYFGSSVDNIVYALAADSGQVHWTYTTDAPIRFAPALFEHRLYVVSDDGFLYCLNAKSGGLIWKKRGGPTGEMVLGNGRMISSWPARGGPAIRDGVLYFAAGIWPTHGIYLHAIDARTGDTIWTNDSAGSITMGQPHPGANAESGVSAQGHLVVTKDKVLVPTGRAVPAAFDRKDGRFLYYHLQSHGQSGGTTTMVTDRVFYNHGVLYDLKTGKSYGKIGAGAIGQRPDGFVHATRHGLVACRWIEKVKIDDEGRKQTVQALDPYLRLDAIHENASILVTDQQVFVGGDNIVRGMHLETKKEAWSAKVKGRVYSLAAANGQIYASTDAGAIYCFSADYPAQPVAISPDTLAKPYLERPSITKAADTIIGQSGITEGFCLDLGCGNGELAHELAMRTNLTIVAVEEDESLVAEARKKLIAAGLYGDRVTVLQRPLAKNGLPKYFANLIVSGRSVSHGVEAVNFTDAYRMQRPYGGVLCVGKPGKMKVERRGPLADAGAWTHQYADPANTVCSNDPIRGPLRPLWFCDVGQAITQRHGRGPSPLCYKGRIFSEGLDTVVAVDAYNGSKLWEVMLPGILQAYEGDHLMGTAGTHGNYCVSDQGLFVRVDNHCLRFDPATGKQLGDFQLPLKSNSTQKGDHVRTTGRRWGYIATVGDSLYGTEANTEHHVTYRYHRGGDFTKQLTESSSFFALDTATGKLKWQYTAKYSIRHNAIAIGGGRVYLIDRPLALDDRKREPGGKNLHPTGMLLALDAETGETEWKTYDNIFGTLLALSQENESLLMAYQPTHFRLASEVGGKLAVFDINSGKRRWEKNANYFSRPIINGKTIYAEGGAWAIGTGETLPFKFRRSYGCGILAAGRQLLVFRSATFGYFDLTAQDKIHNFGGMRPGCWINAIPASGLILIPEGSTGCVCSYQNRCWLALQGDWEKEDRATGEK